MIPEVDRVKLESALDHFDHDFRPSDDWRGWEDNQAHKYAIEWNGRRYPVKKVVSLATGSPVSNFSGGEEANEFVTKPGFKVVPLRGDSAPIPRYWIFQGNPDRFDLEGALDELPEMTWLINQYCNGEIRAVSRVTAKAIKQQRPEEFQENAWARDGRLLRSEYFELNPLIRLDQIANTNIVHSFPVTLGTAAFIFQWRP
jgi:hypothetical protein